VDGADGPDVVIDGIGGAPAGDADVYCGMAGTVGRFIVPMLAAGSGRVPGAVVAALRRARLGAVSGADRRRDGRVRDPGATRRRRAAGGARVISGRGGRDRAR